MSETCVVSAHDALAFGATALERELQRSSMRDIVIVDVEKKRLVHSRLHYALRGRIRGLGFFAVKIS